MKGRLVLIPTPIDDVSLLAPKAKELLDLAVVKNEIILVEELKEGRRRWLRYGLPREAIEHFQLYNEHTRDALCPELIKRLKSGINVYLMSDCGLPAFCDPGRELVDSCHTAGIQVTATPFANSVVLALAMSGFNHNRFIFEGFSPAKKELRIKELKRILRQKETSILMDTPYRLEKLLDEVINQNVPRRMCLALDLNQESEQILRGTAKEIKNKLKNFKREFILILEQLV